MTNIGMMYMTGASDALDQIMTFVTYDVIRSASCGFLSSLYSALNVIAVETLADRHVKDRNIFML